MKTKVVALIASGLFGAGIWGYSQQMGPQNMSGGCPWMTQAQVQHMQNHPMMGWYMHMGQTQFYPDSPMSIAAFQNQLGLSGDQIKQLTAIQEKANTDAKAVLTDEQRTKLGTATKRWKPMSMDHCWTVMNP
jgi:hypothetical protein